MAHNKKYLSEKNFTPFINDFTYIFSLLPFDFDPEMLLNMGNCYFKNLITISFANIRFQTFPSSKIKSSTSVALKFKSSAANLKRCLWVSLIRNPRIVRNSFARL